MRYKINIEEQELNSITIQNLNMYSDSLIEEIKDLEYNDRILNDYDRRMKDEYQKVLSGMKITIEFLQGRKYV